MMQRPYRLGLTGSIGMGKSTTAGFFAEAGVPVWDADASVRRLYAAGGAGAEALALAFPGVIIAGAVDRERLKALISTDPDVLAQVETLIHPLVAADRTRFLETTDAPLLVLDIPLLYEIGAEAALDGVLVVTAPADVQKARVLSRPGMTEAQFKAILARQMPDAEKRARADFVIETTTPEAARSAVFALIESLSNNHA